MSNLEKYYTPPDIAKLVVDKTVELLGNKITQYLEPSCGSGVFLNYLPSNTLSYDIDPQDPRIIVQDYLTLQLPYQQGRCIIGNPPFRCNGSGCLYRKFLNKSTQLGDYISFILPRGLYDNNVQFYQFDLIYTQIIDFPFENRIIACCFNIYQRPVQVNLKKPTYLLKQVQIKDETRTKHGTKFIEGGDIRLYKLRMNGKEISTPHTSCHEMVLFIDPQWKYRVISLLRDEKFHTFVKINCNRTLSNWRVLKYIKSQLPEID